MHLQMILKEIEIPKSVCLLARMDFDILENNHMVCTVIVKPMQNPHCTGFEAKKNHQFMGRQHDLKLNYSGYV